MRYNSIREKNKTHEEEREKHDQAHTQLSLTIEQAGGKRSTAIDRIASWSYAWQTKISGYLLDKS